MVFDRLLITVHPAGCFTARTFIERFLADAVQNDGLSAAARSRLPTGSADLMLRMLNLMVDSYLELRKELGGELDRWQQMLLGPRSRNADWGALMSARAALHMLEDLCEEQNDAMQEWLDTQREQPAPWHAPGRARQPAGAGPRRDRACAAGGAPRAAHGAWRGDGGADPLFRARATAPTKSCGCSRR